MMRRWISTAALLLLLTGSLGATRSAAELLLRSERSAQHPPVQSAEQAIRQASVNGKYDNLLAVLLSAGDHGVYGAFNDYGYSQTAEWAGFKGLPTGYWVYVHPHWYIWKDQHEALVNAPAGLSRNGRAWGPEQVTGEPDTEGPGDISTAWASQTQDEQDEWLILEYAKPILPVAVIVHETHNPGALSRVTLIRPDTEEVDAWKGTDPTAFEKGHGVSIVPIITDTASSKIKLYLDSKRVPGWNEIDAVGLVDQMGRTHWAVRAEASSTYASSNAPPLLPGLGE